jgi:hypothetical protein
MKTIKSVRIPYFLLILFLTFPFIRLEAQTAPVCSASDIPSNPDPADEYYKAMERACINMNNGVYDSVRYHLEKAIFFKGFVSVPKDKRQQLLDFLGKEKFGKLPCFCENPAIIEMEGDSANGGVLSMPENTSSEIELDGATKKDIEEKAVIKCRQFVDYIKAVTGEKSTRDDISNAIESAVALFVNEDCKVEVSSRNKKEPTKYPVRKYFQKLSALHQYYDKIEIIGSRYYIVSSLRKGPDGNYYTVVSFEQIFTGYLKDQITYTDMTKKNIIVMVIQLRKVQEGAAKSVWDVLLKEVQVTETI